MIFGSMPAYVPSSGALGAKLVTFYPQNRDVATHHAVIALFRPETGEPVCVMDGRLITEMRTAAASAVATDLLARRGAHRLACNFSREERRVPVDGGEVLLATHDGARLEDGAVHLPPLAGALVG